MSEKKQNAKHSVGQGAQKEKYNADNEDSYVNKPEDAKEGREKEEGNYLDKKWKKISSDFRAKYNIDVEDSEFKKSSFSEIAERLEKQTGKSRSEIEREIENWQNS